MMEIFTRGLLYRSHQQLLSRCRCISYYKMKDEAMQRADKINGQFFSETKQVGDTVT